MPFWLHESTPIIILKSMRPGIKVVALCGVLGSLVTAYSICFYFPLHKMRQSSVSEYAQLCKQVQQFKDTLRHHTSIWQDYKILTQEVHFLIKNTYAHQQPMALWLNLLHKHGLTCASVEPGATYKKDFYTKQYLNIQGKGTFKNLVALLDDVKTSGQIIKFKYICIDKQRGQTLKFQALVCFRYVKDAA